MNYREVAAIKQYLIDREYPIENGGLAHVINQIRAVVSFYYQPEKEQQLKLANQFVDIVYAVNTVDNLGLKTVHGYCYYISETKMLSYRHVVIHEEPLTKEELNELAGSKSS